MEDAPSSYKEVPKVTAEAAAYDAAPANPEDWNAPAAGNEPGWEGNAAQWQ